MNDKVRSEVESLLIERDNSPVCISLDWLSLYFRQKGIFAEAYEEGDQIVISNDCYLLAIDRPTPHFNTHFVLFHKNEECAHILANPRNERFFKKETVKVDFANHTLYSQEWIKVYDELKKHGLVYHAASRVDIAIDGVGYLQRILNINAKQSIEDITVCLKNSCEARSRFSAKILNTKTYLFENFTIGTHGGNKMITVYNKTLEIAKSGKKYIQDYWLKNGLIHELNDLDALNNEIKAREKKGDEAFSIEGRKNIYRFEIRLKSESIKEIEGFSVEMLKTGKSLAAIVRTHCKKYFEACFKDNQNITLCTSFDLLPYDRLGAKVISKIKRQERGGVYKAKLTIHGLIQDIHKGYVRQDNMNESIEIIFDRAAKYELHDYLRDKLPEWRRLYKNFVNQDRINDVCIVMNRIEAMNSPEDARDIADRNDNAEATARF